MIPVTAVILQKDNKILIARRSTHKHLGGLWELLGGKVEEDETAEFCLQWELEKGLGLKYRQWS